MKKYYVQVSDPWDFIGDDNRNILHGNIIKVTNERCLVFRLSHSVEMDGDIGDILVLKPRYTEDSFAKIDEKTTITVNGCLMTGYKEEMTESDLMKMSKFKMIGSLRQL
jgi:hypothetical protein